MNIQITKELLERYFEGKDENKPEIIENLFSDEAVVTFDIKPDNIYFPSIIKGSKNIASTMFDNFHENFDQVASYYLSSEFPDLEQDKIINLKWLVIMREKNTGLFRIGTGYYDWAFGFYQTTGKQDNGEWKVDKLHIYIHDMVIFNKENMTWECNSNSRFPYPWLPQNLAINELKDKNIFASIYDYLI